MDAQKSKSENKNMGIINPQRKKMQRSDLRAQKCAL